MRHRWLWFVYTVVTVVAWGIWGALIDRPAQAGFPETLGYIVWSLTMIPPAVVALWLAGWKLDRDPQSMLLGAAAGFTGAGGQLVLFKTLKLAPAYLVFPFIALSPLVTIVLAAMLSRERVRAVAGVGIALALAAGVLLAYTPRTASRGESVWVVYALCVLLAWGVQGFVISRANRSMRAESIFFYMMATAVVLSPVAWTMTDFDQEINWGLTGPWQSAAIHILNSVGALLLVYAFRYGKAMIVAPLANAGAPVITIVLSLLLYRKEPNLLNAIGMALAILAAALMAVEGESAEAIESEAQE